MPYNSKKNMNTEIDNYLMDMENSALTKWGNGEFPRGLERASDKKWLKHIEKYIDQCLGLGEAMVQYKEWVLSGGGDEWFVENESVVEEAMKGISEMGLDKMD